MGPGRMGLLEQVGLMSVSAAPSGLPSQSPQQQSYGGGSNRVTAGSLFDFSAFCGFLSLCIIMTHRNNKEVVVTYYVEIPVVVYLKLTDVCLMRVWRVLEYNVISL